VCPTCCIRLVFCQLILWSLVVQATKPKAAAKPKTTKPKVKAAAKPKKVHHYLPSVDISSSSHAPHFASCSVSRMP